MHGRHTEVSEKLPIALGAALCGCETGGEGKALRVTSDVWTALVGVIGVKTFRDNLQVPSSGVENPKESLLRQYRVYKGNCGRLFTP